MDLQVVIGCYGLRNGVMEVAVLFANFSSHQSLILIIKDRGGSKIYASRKAKTSYNLE
jgi:hypothetical protein